VKYFFFEFARFSTYFNILTTSIAGQITEKAIALFTGYEISCCQDGFEGLEKSTFFDSYLC